MQCGADTFVRGIAGGEPGGYPCSSLLISGLEAISHPGIGHNVARRVWRGFQFLAELPYEHAQVFDLLRALTTPDRPQQGAMRYHSAGVVSKIHEKVKLFRSEVDRAVLDKNAAGSGLDLEVARFYRSDFRLFRSRAAKISATARQEFLHAEGLGHVVIRARIQRLDLGTFLTSHREHDDRNLRLRPQPPAQFQSA